MESIGGRLPFQLVQEQWGAINHVEEECPGVFYLGTTMGMEDRVGREMYAVLPSAVPDIISSEAMAYGTEADGVYLFEYEVENSGWDIIKYEILRYKTKAGIALDDIESLYCSAIYSADVYPEYFGGLIPPRCTPWGLTVRMKKAQEGIYFLETDQCEWVLALAHPIWDIELSDAVKKMGALCEHDKGMGDKYAQYLYFQRDKCAPAIYELLTHSGFENLRNFIRSQEVLEAHVYRQNMEYAVTYNMTQVSGHGKCDMLTDILEMLGCEGVREEFETEELQKRREEACIRLNPELAAEELLLLPR
ncbi:MAG: hypothetical protein IJA20_01875 [Methanocorpusculum sp.]|nr:hypothetical protein [Oscillospiraceae bacterium]MBQ3569400.1 hypothetical protein [Methanocorpusculum sp.]